MKKSIKILLLIASIFISIFIFCLSYFLIVSSKYNLDKSKLKTNEIASVVFFDEEDNQLDFNNKSELISIKELNKNTINAFIAIEDKRFYSHNGVDNKAILRALYKDLTSFSLKEGASTITQQVIKNTHLTNEKTLNRKIAEIKLAKQLEKNYTKDEIMEIYLNSIYFGHNCYGISNASKFYFNKSAKELTLNESAVLAGIIKSPLNYSPIKNYSNSIKRKNLVLSEMFKQNLISKKEFDENFNKEIVIVNKENSKYKDYFYLLDLELDEILENKKLYNSKIKIYTNFNKTLQNNIEKSLYNYNVSDSASSIIMDKNGRILAYSSNIGEVNRQLGSIIKPVLVYATAFDEDLITESTILNDEEINFNGYSPKNYGNKTYGNITVKEAISISSNICAVKVLNSTKIETAKNKVKNLPLNLTEKDNFLNIALGSTEKGATLKEITSCYLPFLNNGIYSEPYVIEKITDDNGKILYKHTEKNKKIFDEDSCFLINDCLNECAINGTAKKIGKISKNLCSKTGTVGNEYGNMDAYSISYDKNIISSVWLGNENGSLMNNTVTGGNYPSIINAEIFSKIYTSYGEPTFFDIPSSINKISIDTLSLDEQKIELASDFTPLRYKKDVFFKTKNMPKIISERFSNPKIENYNLSVNNKHFSLSLCVKEYYEYKIIKELYDEKTCIFNSKDNERKNLLEFDIENNASYYIIPYTENIEGEKVFLGKIKSPEIDSGDWWLD